MLLLLIGSVALWLLWFLVARAFLAFAPAHALVLMLAEREPLPRSAGVWAASLVPQIVADLVVYTAFAAGLAIVETRRRQAETEARLRAEVAEARLEALRQQLNPHFLFNTLNHMAVLLRANQAAPALEILLALSELLRKLLREQAQLIPLRDELATLERFLEIERARFGDRLMAEVTFEPKSLDVQVPSLMLQPLLENAMRHGVSKADGSCRVTLTARLRDARLQLEVRDAGPGLETPEQPEGIGLRNTRQRLHYLYGDDHHEDVEDVFNMRRFYDRLTAPMVRDAARTYLNLDRYVMVTMLPETK